MIVFLPSDLSMTVAGVHPCNAVPLQLSLVKEPPMLPLSYRTCPLP